MRVLFILLVSSLGIIFNNCKTKDEKKDITEVAKSYGLIYTAFVTTKQVQNRFFGKATDLLGQVKYNNDVVIDTKELELLLDSATKANETQIGLINLAEEPDQSIRYKEKALRYIMMLKELYNNQFPQLITIFNSKEGNRFERSQKLILAKMSEMSKAMYECHDAGVELVEKYDIKTPDIVE